MWYAAHLIMAADFDTEANTHRVGLQDLRPVTENIYLVDAETVEDAFRQADAIGAANEVSASDGYTYGGRPVKWTYQGVRRLTECIDFEGGPPQSGKEVAYLEYYLEDKVGLQRVLSKQSARILLDGDDID